MLPKMIFLKPKRAHKSIHFQEHDNANSVTVYEYVLDASVSNFS